MDNYIIRIEKDSTGKGIYQLRLYVNGIGNEPFTGNITSFDKVFHYAIETKRYIEVKLHTQLPLSIIGISKDVLDTYGNTDEELKAFLERKELDTVPDKNNKIYNCIINIEKDTGDGRYQLNTYLNGSSTKEPLSENITSFNEIYQHAVEVKEYMEKELNIKFSVIGIGISKDVLDTYGDTDEELKAFLERKELDTVPEVKKGRTTFLDAVKKHLS